MRESQGPVMLAIGRLEGKLDGYQQQLSSQHNRLNNHSDRLSTLEKFKSKLIGIAMAAGVVASAVFKLLPQVLK